MSITDAKRYVDLAAKMLEEEVVKARQDGATWQSIASDLGVTHQGARSRWSKVVAAKALAKTNGDVAPSSNGASHSADHAGRVDTDRTPGPGNDGD